MPIAKGAGFGGTKIPKLTKESLSQFTIPQGELSAGISGITGSVGKTPQKIPLWQTAAFQGAVARLTGQPSTKATFSAPKIVAPLPRQVSGPLQIPGVRAYDPGPTAFGTSRNLIPNFAEVVKAAKAGTFEVPQPAMPRQLFLMSKQPFYLGKNPTDILFEESIKDSTWSEKLTQGLPYYAVRAASALNIGAVYLKTVFTQTPTDSSSILPVIGGAAQFAYSAMTYLYEKGRYLGIYGTGYKEAQWYIDRAEKALTTGVEEIHGGPGVYTRPLTPKRRAELTQELAKAKVRQGILKTGMNYANQTVKATWANLMEAGETAQPYVRAHNPALSEKEREAAQKEIDRKIEVAVQAAEQFEKTARYRYAQGNVESAIPTMVEAIKYRADADPMDTYGAYTWVREPKRYDAFLKDLAFLELQAGRQLTYDEVERLKQYHVNANTELIGEGVFDPLNAPIVDKFFDVVGAAMVKPGKKIFRKVFEHVPVANWFLKEAKTSAANALGNTTNNLMLRFKRAYQVPTEFVDDVAALSRYSVDFAAAPTRASKEAVFKEAKEAIKGINQFTFDEFKHFADVASDPSIMKTVEPGQWSSYLSSFTEEAEDILRVQNERFVTQEVDVAISKGLIKPDVRDVTIARRLEESVEAALAKSAHMDYAVGKWSELFKDAALSPYKIHKDSNLVSDSVGGALIRTMREYAGLPVQETAAATSWYGKLVDNIARAAGEAATGSTARKGVGDWANAIETVFIASNAVRSAWTKWVLARNPRWVIQNYIDSTFRSLVYGGNLYESIADLTFNLQRQLVDELGYFPIEMSQSLSRAGLEFGASAPTRMLYENWSPRFGIFSYLADEYRRLGKDRKEILATLSRNAPEGILKKTMNALSDGWQSIPNAIQDYNTTIEFTLRLRMFHREYFKMLDVLEPRALRNVLGEVSQETREIARTIWSASEGNPARLKATVDDLIKATDRGAGTWSLLVPPDIEKTMLGMDSQGRSLFVGSVREQLRTLIDVAKKQGRKLSADDFHTFFGDMRTKLQDEIQLQISNSYGLREISGGINPEKEVASLPNAASMPGSAPIPKAEPPVLGAKLAVEKLNPRAFGRKANTDMDLFEAAVSPIAEINPIRTRGNAITVAKEGDKIVMSIGEDFIKQKKGARFEAMHEAVIRATGLKDEAYVLGSGFRSVDEYVTTMKKFLNDPTAVLNESRGKFSSIVEQLEANQHVDELLRRTTPNKINYQSAVDNYIVSTMMDDYEPGWQMRFRHAAEMVADTTNKHPPEYRLAARAEHDANGLLFDLVDSGKYSPEMVNRVIQFQKEWHAYRGMLHQYGALIFPGAKRFKGELRGERWKLFYDLMGEQFLEEARIKTELYEMLLRSEDEAGAWLDTILENPRESFLETVGIRPTKWEGDNLVQIQARQHGRWVTIEGAPARALQAFFYDDDMAKVLARDIADNVTINRVDNAAALTLTEQVIKTFRDAYVIPRKEAEAWSRIVLKDAKEFVRKGYGSVDDYLAKFYISKTPDGLVALSPNGLMSKLAGNQDDLGRVSFYGFNARNMTELVDGATPALVDDLMNGLGRKSQEAADSYAAITVWLERNGLPVRLPEGKVDVDALTKEYKELHAQAWEAGLPREEILKLNGRMAEIDNLLRPSIPELTDKQKKAVSKAFSQYLRTGNAPDQVLQQPFYFMKSRLNDIYTELRDSGITTKMAEEPLSILEGLKNSIDDSMEITRNRAEMLMKDAAGVSIPDDELFQAYLQKTGTTAEQVFTNLARDFRAQYDSIAGSSVLTGAEQERLRRLLAESSHLADRELMDGVKDALGLTAARTADPARMAQVTQDINKLAEAAKRRAGTTAWTGTRDEMIKRISKLVKDISNETLESMDNQQLRATLSDAEKTLADSLEARSSVINRVVDMRKRLTFSKLSPEARADFIRGILRKTTDVTPEQLSAFTNDDVLELLERTMAQAGDDTVSRLAAFRGIPQVDELLDGMKVGRDLRKKGPIPLSFSELTNAEKQTLLTRVGGTKPPVEFATELNAAWDSYVQSNIPVGRFPPDALASSDALKSYLERRVTSESREIAKGYEMWLAKISDFEDAIMSLHSTKYKDYVHPPIPEAMIDDGIRAFLEKRDTLISTYDSAFEALDMWEDFMVKAADQGGTMGMNLTPQQLDELRAFAEKAVPAKAEMISKIIKEATDKTNHVMLDYEYTSVGDQFMRNFFPFWKFPSRSLPFWAETMVMHPEIIAAYEKVQRYSETQARQAGATTSKGEVLPSMEGYVRIPGVKDMWFNPLAPLSFRYVLDIGRKASPYELSGYAGGGQEGSEAPLKSLLKESLSNGQIYGFSPAPWVTYGAQVLGIMSKDDSPPWPIIPQISLFPRHAIPETIMKSRMMVLGREFGPIDISGLKELAYPERQGYDYIIINRILQDTLALLDSNDPEIQRQATKIVYDAERAIYEQGDNPIWKKAIADLSSNEATRNQISFFTGIYAKPFTEEQAAVLRLRDENNLLKSAINNKQQAQVFDLPTDPEVAYYDVYINQQKTPQAWVNRLRDNAGWITNDKNVLITDPEERKEELRKYIDNYHLQSTGFDLRERARREFETDMQGIPLGASWEQRKGVYDKLDAKLNNIDREYPSTYERKFGTNKPVELIQKEVKDIFYKQLLRGQPVWREGEDYEAFLDRRLEWEQDILPKRASDHRFLESFQSSQRMVDIISSLKKDQKLGPNFIQELIKDVQSGGLEQWRLDRDSVFDAMNNVIAKNYVEPYYDAIKDENGEWLSSYPRIVAERTFADANPVPDEKTVYRWVKEVYGDKFTEKEIAKWMATSGIYNAGEASKAMQTPLEQTRDDTYNLLSYGGPGKGTAVLQNSLAAAILKLGYDDINAEMIGSFYDSEGYLFINDPEKGERFKEALLLAVDIGELTPPQGDELNRMATAYDQNKKFKELVEEGMPGFYGYQQFWYGLNYDAQKQYKKTQEGAQIYKMVVKDYKKYREAFGLYNPEWAQYYLGKEITSSAPAISLESKLPPAKAFPALENKQFRLGTQVRNIAGTADYNPALPSVPPRTGTAYVKFPKGMYTTIGIVIADEIRAVVSGQAELSYSTRNYLLGLSKRRPEWSLFISDILSR